MKNTFGFLLIAAILLSACQHKSDYPALVGSIDSLAIASDTTTQLGIEASYEYHQTLALNENEVFDVVAYGSPAKGEVAFIFRNAEGLKDTVAKAERAGIVKACWFTDLNKNNQPEIMLVLQSYDTSKFESLLGFEMQKEKSAIPIKFNIDLLKQYVQEYRGKDTMYYERDAEIIHHEFPLVEEGHVKGRMKIKYGLKGDKIETKDFSIEQY